MSNRTLVVSVVAIVAIVVGMTGYAVVSAWHNDRRDLEAVIQQYLTKHPEVVVEAIRTYRAREQAMRDTRTKARIASFVSSVDNNPSLPVGGNPEGDITIVEFFDYRCGYCKRVLPVIRDLMETDGQIRLVYAELPILGDDSLLASRAATAVWLNWPDKYAPYHNLLMASVGKLDSSVVFESAFQVGIEADELAAAMEAEGVSAAIAANRQLATQLDIKGTPAFIIGDRLMSGAVALSMFREIIADYRAVKAG